MNKQYKEETNRGSYDAGWDELHFFPPYCYCVKLPDFVRLVDLSSIHQEVMFRRSSEVLFVILFHSDVKLDVFNKAELRDSANVMGVIWGSVEPGEIRTCLVLLNSIVKNSFNETFIDLIIDFFSCLYFHETKLFYPDGDFCIKGFIQKKREKETTSFTRLSVWSLCVCVCVQTGM